MAGRKNSAVLKTKYLELKKYANVMQITKRTACFTGSPATRIGCNTLDWVA